MPVQRLSDGYCSPAYTPSDWSQLEADRFPSKTAPVLLGQLFCGVQAADERVHAFNNQRARSHCLPRLHADRQRKQGRPVQA